MQIFPYPITEVSSQRNKPWLPFSPSHTRNDPEIRLSFQPCGVWSIIEAGSRHKGDFSKACRMTVCFWQASEHQTDFFPTCLDSSDIGASIKREIRKKAQWELRDWIKGKWIKAANIYIYIYILCHLSQRSFNPWGLWYAVHQVSHLHEGARRCGDYNKSHLVLFWKWVYFERCYANYTWTV